MKVGNHAGLAAHALRAGWAFAFVAGAGVAGTGIAGCGATAVDDAVPVVPGQRASALIGPAGGTVELGSLRVVVPEGAVPAEREVRVIVEGSVSPSGFTDFSPSVRFEPEGLAFARPVEVHIPFDGDPSLATVFYRARSGDAFSAGGTRVANGVAITEVSQVAQAFVGTACEGASCCDAGNGELDLLLVVDTSASMTEEQALLANELPRIARILASGDRDGDGIQDFPAIASLQVGIVTTDIGASGESSVPTCSAWGDDGLLRTDSANAGCAASYAPIHRFDASSSLTPDDFAADVACVSVAGAGGCGFEQQLEATLLAISPSAPTDYTAAGWQPASFVGTRTGRGDGANVGLVRDDSILAVLEITDEDDTSVRDAGLFVQADPRFDATPLNLRGHAYADPSLGFVQPVSRYVDGLVGLRADPADLVFGLVAGVPTDAVTDAAHADFDQLLARSEMAGAVNETGDNLVPSCSSPNGVAFPPRRLVETARGLDAAGAGTVVASICDASFDALLDGLIDRIAARAAGSCE